MGSRVGWGRRTAVRSLVALVVLGLAVGAGWWAGRATLVSSASEGASAEGPDVTWATAMPATVGRTLALSTTVRRPSVVVAENALSGVVTEVRPGEASQGSVLYVVGDLSVRAVRADRPFWRDLVPGVRGEDVRALQDALVEMGYLRSADSTFGTATGAAVRAWQRDLGQPLTGTVPLGEVVALSSLPTTVRFGDEVAVGRQVAGGEDAVLAPAGEREFVMAVTSDQQRMIPQETTIEVSYGDHTWTAVIARVDTDENGLITLVLAGPDGGPVCAEACDVLPADPEVTLASQVVIVPAREGIGVPAAAVRSRADASTFVVTEDGEVDVTVLGGGQGVVIVDGLAEGTRVQVATAVEG